MGAAGVSRYRSGVRPLATTRIALIVCAAAFAGCTGPLDDRPRLAMRDAVIAGARRELRVPHEPVPTGDGQPGRPPTRSTPAPEVEYPPERLAELERMAGPQAPRVEPVEFGDDLLGGSSPVVVVSLAGVVATAVENNLDAKVARFEPAITDEQLAAARAAFDWTFFTDFNHANIDRPQPAQFFGNGQVGSRARVAQSVQYETGLRKPLTTGGQLALSQGQTYTDDDSPSLDLRPEPSNAAQVTARLDQPLLRDAGAVGSTAQIKLAANAREAAGIDVAGTLIQVVTQTEQSYWRLAASRRALDIAQRLLRRGEETRTVLRGRTGFDAKPAEISDAEATVARRRAQVIRAGDQLRRESDRLKQIVNSPEFPLSSEALVLASDDTPPPTAVPSLGDAIMTAIASRPEVQRAILDIDDAAIREQVAVNASLPRLNVALQAQFQGLDTGAGGAYDQVNEGRFVDYLVGVSFEQPIGNAAAKAGVRQRQSERLRAAVAYKRVLLQVVGEVKSALRSVRTAESLVEQTARARLAAAENLRTLEVQEKTIQSLTPDFLDLKFRRQENLANAELDEAQAQADYRAALAELAAAQGVALERHGIALEQPVRR